MSKLPTFLYLGSFVKYKARFILGNKPAVQLWAQGFAWDSFLSLSFQGEAKAG